MITTYRADFVAPIMTNNNYGFGRRNVLINEGIFPAQKKKLLENNLNITSKPVLQKMNGLSTKKRRRQMDTSMYSVRKYVKREKVSAGAISSQGFKKLKPNIKSALQDISYASTGYKGSSIAIKHDIATHKRIQDYKLMVKNFITTRLEPKMKALQIQLRPVLAKNEDVDTASKLSRDVANFSKFVQNYLLTGAQMRLGPNMTRQSLEIIFKAIENHLQVRSDDDLTTFKGRFDRFKTEINHLYHTNLKAYKLESIRPKVPADLSKFPAGMQRIGAKDLETIRQFSKNKPVAFALARLAIAGHDYGKLLSDNYGAHPEVGYDAFIDKQIVKTVPATLKGVFSLKELNLVLAYLIKAHSYGPSGTVLGENQGAPAYEQLLQTPLKSVLKDPIKRTVVLDALSLVTMMDISSVQGAQGFVFPGTFGVYQEEQKAIDALIAQRAISGNFSPSKNIKSTLQGLYGNASLFMAQKKDTLIRLSRTIPANAKGNNPLRGNTSRYSSLLETAIETSLGKDGAKQFYADYSRITRILYGRCPLQHFILKTANPDGTLNANFTNQLDQFDMDGIKILAYIIHEATNKVSDGESFEFKFGSSNHQGPNNLIHQLKNKLVAGGLDNFLTKFTTKVVKGITQVIVEDPLLQNPPR